MKINVHEETGSWGRSAAASYSEPGTKRHPRSPWIVTEIDPTEEIQLRLEFDHFEHHNTSVTVWLRKVEANLFRDADGDTEYRRVPTTILLPMRMKEWEKVVRTKVLMQGRFSGTFVVNKRGNSISLELKE